MKTETTIIMIDKDDAVRQRSWRPTDKLFFLDVWFMTNALQNVLLS